MTRATPQPDYYQALGVARSASARQIVAAYRKLARELRPDLYDAPTWPQIAAAYAVLGDERKRAAYDQGLDPNLRRPQHQVRTANTQAEITSRLRLDRAPGPPRGSDVIICVPDGGNHRLRYRRYAPCDSCAATGLARSSSWATCLSCQGGGEVRRQRLIWLGWLNFGFVDGGAVCARCQGRGVVIPAPCPQCKAQGRVQIEDEITVTLTCSRAQRIVKRGNAGIRGGKCGDLWVVACAAGCPYPCPPPLAPHPSPTMAHRFTASVWRMTAKVIAWLRNYAREFGVLSWLRIVRRKHNLR